VDFKGQLFFSVQLLATNKIVPLGYFNKIVQTMPNPEILKYTDMENSYELIFLAY
jgi:hypothetical protein